eukprot:408594-Prymnesium_polylepis.1
MALHAVAVCPRPPTTPRHLSPAATRHLCRAGRRGRLPWPAVLTSGGLPHWRQRTTSFGAAIEYCVNMCGDADSTEQSAARLLAPFTVGAPSL